MTAARWVGATSAIIQAVLGGDPLLKSGGTMTGLLATVASAAGSAGLRLAHGSAPTSPTNGDVWTTTSGLFARINGTTEQYAKLASPSFTTPTLGVATGTSLALGGASIGSDALAITGTASADAYLTNSSNVNAQTGTSYTLVNGDNGKTVTMNNGSASTLTVPASLTAGFACTIVQLGAGQVTITASSTTLRNRNGLKLGGQYAQAGLIYIATDTYSVAGDLTT